MKLGRWILAILFLWGGQAWGDPRADAAVRQLVSLGVKETTARSVVERWMERDERRDPRPLLQTLQRSSENGAPVDLMLDKTAEGLAKGVSGDRLLSALDGWGKSFSQAARLARVIRDDLNSEGISERETILRLGILQRLRKDDGWLRRLEEEAKQHQVNLHGFLQVSEAVGHLTGRLGLQEQEADDLGALWMQKRMPPNEVNRLVRAIERGQKEMSISEAARAVTESVLRGAPLEDALGRAEKAQEDKEKKKTRGNEEERMTQERSGRQPQPSAAEGRKNPSDDKKDRESRNKEKEKKNK